MSSKNSNLSRKVVYNISVLLFDLSIILPQPTEKWSKIKFPWSNFDQSLSYLLDLGYEELKTLGATRVCGGWVKIETVKHHSFLGIDLISKIDLKSAKNTVKVANIYRKILLLEKYFFCNDSSQLKSVINLVQKLLLIQTPLRKIFLEPFLLKRRKAC